MLDESNHQSSEEADMTNTDAAARKWGALASFVLAAAFIIAPAIYLFGDLRSAVGPFAYDVADFLYGPVWAAGFITAFFALRESIGGRAPRRMSMALGAAFLAAGLMLLVACIRSANRHYHLIHPELQLENSVPVLTVWTTLIAGTAAAGWHLLGWALVLTGWAGWGSGRLPRGLCAVYLAGGLVSLFVYVFPNLEEPAVLLGIAWSIWQGILLWKARPENPLPSG